MPRARLLLLVLSLAFVPVLARAEPRPPMMAQLEYQRGVGAESCMDESGLRIEVARRSGYDPFTPQARARLAVTVTRQGGQFLGTMQFFDDAGAPGWRRTYPVSSNDCVTLISAMGSEISYQFQPSPAVTEPVRSLLPPPPPPPPSAAIASPPLHPAPEPFRPVELSAGGFVSAGSAPAIAVGATLSAGYRFRTLSLAGELRFTAPASDNVASLPGARISAFAFGGAVVPCVRVAPVFGCAVLSIAEVFASSTGVDAPRKDAGLYVGAGLRGGIEAPISPRFALRLSVEGLASVRSARLILDGTEVWKTSPISGAIGAALVTYF